MKSHERKYLACVCSYPDGLTNRLVGKYKRLLKRALADGYVATLAEQRNSENDGRDPASNCTNTVAAPDPAVATSTSLEKHMNANTLSTSTLRRMLASTKSILRVHKVGSSLAIGSLMLLSVAAVVNSTVSAQTKPSADIDQCENVPATCDSSNSSNWTNGNLGQHNSSYPETSSVPFRAVMNNLVANSTYSILIEWDTTVNSGDHAFDYLTTFNRTEATADPCAGVTCSSPTNTLTIPVDPNVTAAGVTQLGGQVFTIRGGEFPANGASIANTGNLCATSSCSIATNPSAYTLSDPYTQNSSTRIRLYFTAKATTVVLAWGGHVAAQADWGAGNSAIDIPGSPYHMMLLSFLCSDDSNCGTGRQDLSMSSLAVAPVTTTTDPSTTTTVEETTTTVEETTTTVQETTTTAGGDTTTTEPANSTTTITSDTAPQIFPSTGSNSNRLWMLASTLILLGSFVVASVTLRNKKWR